MLEPLTYGILVITLKTPVPSVMALLRPNGHFYDHVADVQSCRELQELSKNVSHVTVALKMTELR